MIGKEKGLVVMLSSAVQSNIFSPTRSPPRKGEGSMKMINDFITHDGNSLFRFRGGVDRLISLTTLICNFCSVDLNT